jgi:hypothetical protein
MEKLILSLAAIIKSNDKVLGNAQVYYHYHYYPQSEERIVNACFVTANVMLLSKEEKIYTDNWLENVIENTWDNSQGVKLIESILKKELGDETPIEIDVQIERYNLHQSNKRANHVIVMQHHKDKRQFVFLPGYMTEKEIPYSADFKQIATQYLKKPSA